MKNRIERALALATWALLGAASVQAQASGAASYQAALQGHLATAHASCEDSRPLAVDSSRVDEQDDRTWVELTSFETFEGLGASTAVLAKVPGADLDAGIITLTSLAQRHTCRALSPPAEVARVRVNRAFPIDGPGTPGDLVQAVLRVLGAHLSTDPARMLRGEALGELRDLRVHPSGEVDLALRAVDGGRLHQLSRELFVGASVLLHEPNLGGITATKIRRTRVLEAGFGARARAAAAVEDVPVLRPFEVLDHVTAAVPGLLVEKVEYRRRKGLRWGQHVNVYLIAEVPAGSEESLKKVFLQFDPDADVRTGASGTMTASLNLPLAWAEE
jgi:hypothetical protein